MGPGYTLEGKQGSAYKKETNAALTLTHKNRDLTVAG